METVLAIIGWLNPVSWWNSGKNWWRRPILDIYFDPAETYHERGVVNEGGVPGYFCHLMVRNRGTNVAKGCRARLIRVDVFDADHAPRVHPDFVSPCVLKWAHQTDYGGREIESDLPRRLDLCYSVQSNPTILTFFTPQAAVGNRTEFSPGKYRVTVRVDAENAETVDGVFIVNHTGVWQETEVATARSGLDER